MSKTKIIYLLGAGRSGTTLMSVILNSLNEIHTVGELHQYPDYQNNNRKCSCGESIRECDFFSEVYKKIEIEKYNLKSVELMNDKYESHKMALFIFFKLINSKRYLDFQEYLFNSIKKQTSKTYLLDSSKYASRYLLLKKSEILDVTAIYIVRDVRGVIHSFGKAVQTSKSPLKALLYYVLINLLAEFICLFDKKILKVRYEDIVSNTDDIIETISDKVLNVNVIRNLDSSDYRMPHIIGGNRMKKEKSIRIKYDEAWRKNIKRRDQIFYYLLALPIMLINKYKI